MGYNHSCQVNAPLHPGVQGSGLPNQRETTQVGGQSGNTPLWVRGPPHPHQFMSPSLLSPFRIDPGKLSKGSGTSSQTRFLSIRGTTQSSRGGGGGTTPLPRGLHRIERTLFKYLFIFINNKTFYINTSLLVITELYLFIYLMVSLINEYSMWCTLNIFIMI